MAQDETTTPLAEQVRRRDALADRGFPRVWPAPQRVARRMERTTS